MLISLIGKHVSTRRSKWKQGYCDDDTSCTIKVESSDKVTKLFLCIQGLLRNDTGNGGEPLFKNHHKNRFQQCFCKYFVTKSKMWGGYIIFGNFVNFMIWLIFIVYRASDHGDSPSYSSLNHSYKIRNMLDNGDTASVVAPNPEPDKNENIPRPPHSPAPPIPAPKYESKSRV